MASIADLCWTTSQDLFADLDLDALYVRQLRAIGAEGDSQYPCHILVHTGKITIGINLGSKTDVTRGNIFFQGSETGTHDSVISVWDFLKEPVD
ncbi:MAG: hypothetical protein NTW27_00400 [Deltaproteobacteria bacterium]|nr:hypothetical protein [Deltaproteobacteria bacterium]